MAILAAYMVPHPPMIVPQIGKGSEKQITKTIRAYETVADEIAALKPETIIISSPHSTLYADYFHISHGKSAAGDFGRFGASEVSFRETYDAELRERICCIAKEKDFPAGTLGERDGNLDHGTMVPLYFIEQKYQDFQLIRIGLSGLSLADHYAVGQIIRQAEEETGRKRTPVIFLTGSEDSETERRGLKEGASDFVRKPFDKDILIQRICNQFYAGLFSLFHMRSRMKIIIISRQLFHSQKVFSQHIQPVFPRLGIGGAQIHCVASVCRQRAETFFQNLH